MKSVLSIQSHVSHGYVGGKAAIFPLQTQGWEVDNINTVNFSNHTGYGSFKGTSLTSNELNDIMNQLINKLHISYRAIITGYIPNASLIKSTNEYISLIKQKQKDEEKVIYLLDPVMGDNNYLYVDKSCILEYQSILHNKLVDIITPNQFELELLTNMKIIDKFSLVEAINKLHNDYDIPYVVVTSITGGDIFKSPQESEDKYIHCVISTKDQPIIKVFDIPMIKSYFTGVGDLFSALLLDKFYKNKNDAMTNGIHDSIKVLSRSVNQVLTIMAKTLKLTHKLGIQQAIAATATTTRKDINDKDNFISGKINDGDTMKYFELKIIQAKDYYDYNGDGEFIEKVLELN
ncbi:bud polarity/site selection protein (BUD family), putative [Candida dubliniensis CD36]|uniref:pyridoxal kinase n=1 Tax=Candida dubliniensis (strain CD36 / ATCC MYA-646 / CBS 7987 / NCPF 3949 / NRRL Y-17841) TaxID=573826 RepID=B9W826_CANDC|nr:bud polarity/site selection protein (BUD family), putative [Candida dubliniensis CD36]CAX44845.1 bud polarity/site selection protein (BUD family), putative [Candida dubliniensis CD36]